MIKPVQLQQDQNSRHTLENLRSVAPVAMQNASRPKRGDGSIQFHAARALSGNAHQFGLCASGKNVVPALIASKGYRLGWGLKREPGTVDCLQRQARALATHQHQRCQGPIALVAHWDLAKRVALQLGKQPVGQAVNQGGCSVRIRRKQPVQRGKRFQRCTTGEAGQFCLKLGAWGRFAPGLQLVKQPLLDPALRGIVHPQRHQFRSDQHPDNSLRGRL